MGHCYSLDLRVRVADFVEAGHTCRAAAEHFDVRIPTQSGQVFRFEAGQHSGMKPDTVPINHRTLSSL